MSKPKPIERPAVTRAAIAVDRAMNHLIKVGGISVIAAVFGILVFILWQILPLFRGARVEPIATLDLPAGDYRALGADEWTELPFVADADGYVTFLDLSNDGARDRRPLPLPAGTSIAALSYSARLQQFALGTTSGEVAIVQVRYTAGYTQEQRRVTASLVAGPAFKIGHPGAPIAAVQQAGSEKGAMLAVLQDVEGRRECHVATLTQKRTLAGAGRLVLDRQMDATRLIAGRPVAVLVNSRMDGLLAVTDDDRVHYIFLGPAGLVLRQTFRPFADHPGDGISTADFLFGDDSVVFTSREGRNVVFSLFPLGADGTRLFSQTKAFPDLPGPGIAFAPSLRNKAFFVASRHDLSLRFSTTESVRWQSRVPYTVRLAALGGKYDRLLVLDDQHRLHLHALRDSHPEAGLRAFFGRIWYEGSAAPKYEWQSTGGTDEFEPKLSMVPLLLGTLKGTLYAMIFSVPLALLAALYTSQFAHPSFKRWIKPAMEIMASLPSVILGFLSALWLAPLLETRVPSVLLMSAAIPAVTLAFGFLVSRLPYAIRCRVHPGYEFLAVVPLVLCAGYGAWTLGPWLESFCFVGRDLATGEPIADFRLWWTQVAGLAYEQRNSLVVGCMMGFAVIPIIFTIAEDALSNVPPAFRSASLALGASRWQTAMRVVLPTASAGIFSAVMIGFGRAVGETMIVLMATGNTPIMDFNIFSGMRTLSANIAVELPEAPHHGTLFRALYLGALLLFLLTFAVNTLAEILRHHLREKFKAV